MYLLAPLSIASVNAEGAEGQFPGNGRCLVRCVCVYPAFTFSNLADNTRTSILSVRMIETFERGTGQPRALVVEYDRWLRTMVALLLEDLGFDVATASNGFTGLRHALEWRPELVVVGRVLPELSRDALARELEQQAAGASVPQLVDSDALIGDRCTIGHHVDDENRNPGASRRNAPVHATGRRSQHDRQRQHRTRTLIRMR